MAAPQRGEVWRVDLGLAGKVRPALVVSTYPEEKDYSLIAIVPHTTSTRGAAYEVILDVPFLLPDAFNIQGLAPLPPVRFTNRFGLLTEPQIDQTNEALDRWLCLG